MHRPRQKDLAVRRLYAKFVVHVILCIQRTQFRNPAIQFMDHSPHDKSSRNREIKGPFIVDDLVVLPGLKDIGTDQINICRTYTFIVVLSRMFSEYFSESLRLILPFSFPLCEHLLIYMFQGSQNLTGLFFFHQITDPVFECLPAQYRIHDSAVFIPARKIVKSFSRFLRSCFFQSRYKAFRLRAQWFFLCPHAVISSYQLCQCPEFFPASLIQFDI